jgi:hypothetical protein
MIVYDLRFSSYFGVYDHGIIYGRNTVTCNTEKYGHIQSVYRMDTIVYDTVYGRKQSCMESVNPDLGIGVWIVENDLGNRRNPHYVQHLSFGDVVVVC